MILLKLSHTFNGWRRSPQRLPRNHTNSSLVPQFRCNLRAPGSIPIPVPIQLYLVFASDSTFQLRPWLTTWKSCFFHLHWQVLLRIKLAILGYHDQQHFRSLLTYSTLSHWQCWHYLAISRWSRFQRHKLSSPIRPHTSNTCSFFHQVITNPCPSTFPKIVRSYDMGKFPPSDCATV